MPNKPFMKCQNSKKDCFANKNDLCRCLTDTRFKNPDGTVKSCPFYKKKEEEN